MNREVAALTTLADWLSSDDHDRAPGWEPDPPSSEQGYDARLGARLSEISRTQPGVRRRFVAGCPVIEHPRGRAIAAAAGSSWLVVRSAMPPGALETPPGALETAPGALKTPPGTRAALAADWVELDPWAPDTAFARAIDLLRAHFARAYERAVAEAGA